MDTNAFETPCGALCLTDAENRPLEFTVRQEIWEYPASVYDLAEDRRVPVRTTHQYTVFIPAERLQIGEAYTLRLCGDFPYAYGDSDEMAIANAVTAEGFSLSLGARDPNDIEKDMQWVPVLRDGVRIGCKPPEQYDESKFRGYLLEVLPDWSGFRFRLLDRSIGEITFRLAWILHQIEFAEPDDFTAAVTLWTII